MNDEHIDEVLRQTLAARAATVTHGPTWDEDEAPPDIAPHRYRRARWLAPLAAAAVVLAVVGAVFAVRGKDERNQPAGPSAAGQVAVPQGMKAVDALGVEIFVPSDFAVDDACAQRSVTLPLAGDRRVCFRDLREHCLGPHDSGEHGRREEHRREDHAAQAAHVSSMGKENLCN